MLPDDVGHGARVLRRRILLSYEAEADEIDADVPFQGARACADPVDHADPRRTQAVETTAYQAGRQD